MRDAGMHSEDQTLRKRISPFFVKDILGLSDDSETDLDLANESSDDTNRESGNEEIIDCVDDVNNNGKKTRQCFTSKQVEKLERLFNETNYPDAYTRQMLAKKMKVSETRIQIWCQNRRAKIRRQRKQRKPIIHGLPGPHGLYYSPSNSPWLQHPFPSLLRFPVLPSSPRRSPINSPVSETSRLYYRTNNEDMIIDRPEYYTRAKHELQEYSRMQNYTT